MLEFVGRQLGVGGRFLGVTWLLLARQLGLDERVGRELALVTPVRLVADVRRDLSAKQTFAWSRNSNASFYGVQCTCTGTGT